MHYYRICGLTVSSDIALPGVNAWRDDCTAPEVVIREGAIETELVGEAVQRSPTWQLRPGQVLLHIHGVAGFQLSGGREICYQLDKDGSGDDLSAFLIGTVFGILLHQRGQVVLHASAVRVGDRAVLFCGPSGAGKSTMAASLNQRGYPLVTDDVCAIDVSGTPLVHPDGRLLKLWSQAIEALELGGRQGAHVRASLSKHFVEPTGVSNEPLEIGAIYVLTEANPTCERGIRRASLVECGTLLHRNAYRPTLIARLGQEALYFRGVAQIAASGCIFRLVRRQDFAELPGVVTELERHWKDTGLVASD